MNVWSLNVQHVAMDTELTCIDVENHLFILIYIRVRRLSDVFFFIQNNIQVRKSKIQGSGSMEAKWNPGIQIK